VQIGIDYRPALVNVEGIGRYTRELVRALVELEGGEGLWLFGATLRGARFSRRELSIAGSAAKLRRWRLPSRWIPWLLARTGRGVDDLLGGCEVYHHTQPNHLPVRRAREVVTLFDCIYQLDAENPAGPGFLAADVAERMTAAARRIVQRASRVLVPCEFVGAEVVLALGAPPERVSITSLGCDHVLRGRPPEGFPPAEHPYLLTVARVDRRKNHPRMLAAFERLVAAGHPHRWLVVGPRGWGAKEFEDALARSPAADRVEWRRDVADGELPRLYAQADLLLWASLNEGFGLPPLEAMALGTAVVASAVTSMPEVCGEAAALVEPTEVESIFAAAAELLDDPELLRERERLGRARAAEFTWRRCARETLAAYQSAAAGEREGAPTTGRLF